MENIVRFQNIYPDAIPPMRADKSALGTLPVASYQYCEPVRTASAYGWYVFPPTDIGLMWTGSEVFYRHEDDWRALSSVQFEDEFLDQWNKFAPVDLQGRAPPYLSCLFVPGIVQIWSGLFVSTVSDWSVLIRPLANFPQSTSFACYEGIVETDRFKPLPLFVNIRLISTNREITISKWKPLFQVQPVRRECYSEATLGRNNIDTNQSNPDGIAEMSNDDWSGFRKTIRDADPKADDHTTGSYGVSARRRSKTDNN